jgi:LysM repeat protein
MIKLIFLSAMLMTSESDSLRMETIDGKKFIIHQVDAGETLFALSKRYGVPVVTLLEHNPTADAGLEVGQLLKVLYIPRTAKTTAEGTIHKVAPKETLFSVAKMYDVTVNDIKLWNNLSDNSLKLGQELLIKKGTTATVPVTQTVPPVQSVKTTHTVAAKETMYSIARQYSISVDQLKQWNNLAGNELKVGQVLFVTQPMYNTQVTPPPTNTPVVTQPVKISEGISGTSELKETGLAALIEGTEGNRKYLAQHRTIKPGTILKVRNEATGREVFVRVTGPLSDADPTVIIKISKSALDRLGATSTEKMRVEVTYYK